MNGSRYIETLEKHILSFLSSHLVPEICTYIFQDNSLGHKAKNIWAHIKDKVRSSKFQAQSLKELKELVQKEWDATDLNICQTYCLNMENCLIICEN
ncbi:hypothetical protein PHYBLDRAFT_138366 [Phycomyces blakesleeanus NRRL 1555(-)]|uniref:Tc1-like transposase DDE domain-containing protein n=1 Tax=Phycomyces blakesleeanus (strain ATCC 8743b / DSM 1359 / FGSC 10004 / NBRC 33097 / NRRL 1555) TaxID=763407 RepID=A0A162Q7R1_PHYB8|nr:hypothetical protein PHYBLDRAFT_138366 [Phycomyces blakesleeanus NRRL 1555(-)]OAD80816.1 hypothetical protein PHYBLDRAFT_138366 [Phycomyces blakesleeanus NRRL 1555(-)]|eukprot:XP_018298856.1 hypothetical protein PHYBLDRAFT_138366 [Phycomyces blakesleeanus NRRL 1555(-)]